MTDGSILTKAHELIHGDRRASYGHPSDDYGRTVAAFNALTGHNLTVEEGVLFMVCVKLSRQQHTHSPDNLIDAAGYIGCMDMVIQKSNERSS